MSAMSVTGGSVACMRRCRIVVNINTCVCVHICGVFLILCPLSCHCIGQVGVLEYTLSTTAQVRLSAGADISAHVRGACAPCHV
jgi:hypothetical protein